ncbi:MAG: hypothetical protein WD468_12555 [Pirellulales bacterium]
MISAEKVYAMLGNESLWETAKVCHEALAGAHTPYAIAGGVAVCLHGYQRNTVDLDLLVQAGQSDVVRQALESAGMTWYDEQREFRTAAGVAIHFLVSGERAGRGSEVTLPDPANPGVVTVLEGLPVLSLAALIEAKIACGQANMRRTHKDFADVVELIAKHDLGRDFARHLHKSVRGTFRQLVLHGRAE